MAFFLAFPAKRIQLLEQSQDGNVSCSFPLFKLLMRRSTALDVVADSPHKLLEFFPPGTHPCTDPAAVGGRTQTGI